MGRQGEKRQVGAARRRSRGHGLARLDGTRPRATVASKVMESGETAGHGNGRRDVQTARKRSAQARSWKPGRRRQPSGARERWKPEQGRDSCNEARCAARQRDRPCFWAGDARHVCSFSLMRPTRLISKYLLHSIRSIATGTPTPFRQKRITWQTRKLFSLHSLLKTKGKGTF